MANDRKASEVVMSIKRRYSEVSPEKSVMKVGNVETYPCAVGVFMSGLGRAYISNFVEQAQEDLVTTICLFEPHGLPAPRLLSSQVLG